jgi:predicted phage replisome organizer
MNLQFLKLNPSIFDDTKIKIIRKNKEGDKFFNIWIWCLCNAMNSTDPGFLLIGEGIPFEIENISDDIQIDEEITEKAIELFIKLNMIEVTENGYYITNFEKHQNLEKIKRVQNQTKERVTRYRERNKLVTASVSNATDKIRLDENRQDKSRLDEIRLDESRLEEIANLRKTRPELEGLDDDEVYRLSQISIGVGKDNPFNDEQFSEEEENYG